MKFPDTRRALADYLAKTFSASAAFHLQLGFPRPTVLVTTMPDGRTEGPERFEPFTVTVYHDGSAKAMDLARRIYDTMDGQSVWTGTTLFDNVACSSPMSVEYPDDSIGVAVMQMGIDVRALDV